MQQKITFRNSHGLKLAGVLHHPNEKTNSAIIICHGFSSNKDKPRLVMLAELLCTEGFTVLRFDFGGCGESDDREISVKEQVNDLNSAISYLRNKGYPRVGLVGHSLGGLTAILGCDKKIKALVLWAPVTTPKKQSVIKKEFSHVMNKGYPVIILKDGREFKIPKKYFEERSSVNQEKMLSKIRSPVLIIHGDKDEVIPLKNSETAMNFLSKLSVLAVIKGGDHRLDNRIKEVISLSVDWFKKYFV